MAEVLSQQEIDALLSALNSGEIQAADVTETKEKVKVYDFKRAMRYSKEQLRSIMRIHENFTRLLTSYLSAQLRTLIQIEIDLVDQVTYNEFIASIPSKTILTVFDVQPMDGKIVMEINPQVAYGVIERLLGGHGDPTTRDGSLTEIETVLIQKVFARGFELYPEGWKNIENIELKMEVIESNPQFLQLASPNDTMIIIALKTTIGEITGRMTICLPHHIVEPVLPKLSTQQWLTTMTKRNTPQHDKIKQNLDHVRVPVIAELGQATLPVSELMQLQVGDVIGIDMDKIHIKLGKTSRFLGNPGIQKGRYAVQIEQIIQTEGDEQ
ncbi:flagellar motor switch protein FliM [Neobacillus sedimentimangrovi]|uniref:Flagellar motor switch protein FliM n=1 Tax=Neobacillus sedimentimangrovi TaxID=2699460 RepID=A0ABS8QK94_9BACI|nr:flagellar motor switch protein FliM [Neobacillus sedimentimangrovi]AIM14920.1 flagellar motor switch protein FliM [Bacillus sp. X1(2014)]MCD4839185.1 flagellar motor switch protein FliM [Neobacillus sedimentimangrovi]